MCDGSLFLQKIRFAVFFFYISNCLSMQVPPYVSDDTWYSYRSNWYSMSENNGWKYFPFHNEFGAIVARTKLNREPDKPDNIAAFGFTLRDKESGIVIKYVTILPLVCSTIDQIKDPIISSNSSQVVTVRDLLGEDIIHKKHRAHKVLELSEWLAPWEYTKNWNMQELISYEREIIENSCKNPNRNTLCRLTILKPVDQKIGKAAGDVFHCEQIIIYKLLTDPKFLSGAICELMEGVDMLPSKICLDLDIITFNDMCPKCFSTIFHRFEEIKLEISRSIISYFQILKKTELLSNLLPITFRVLVSSIRPYKIETANTETNLKTRECGICRQSQEGPCCFIKTIATRHISAEEKNETIPMQNGIFQFINPQMEEVFGDIRRRYQKIINKVDELKKEKDRISTLNYNSKELQQKIEETLQKKVYPSTNSVKSILNTDCDELILNIDALIKQAKDIQ